jgi:hypothetical protein
MPSAARHFILFGEAGLTGLLPGVAGYLRPHGDEITLDKVERIAI